MIIGVPRKASYASYLFVLVNIMIAVIPQKWCTKIDPDGKAFYSNTLDGVTSFCGYCPIIFSLLKCSLVEKLIAKSHLANLGK